MRNRVLLAQTDTTVGFLSQDCFRLADVKQRSSGKPFLKVFDGLRSFSEEELRIPRAFRRDVRKAKRTTFVVKNRAFRIVRDSDHLKLLRRLKWAYSTSANPSGEGYDVTFCAHNSDIIVQDRRGLHEAPPSSIIRLGRRKRMRLR